MSGDHGATCGRCGIEGMAPCVSRNGAIRIVPHAGRFGPRPPTAAQVRARDKNWATFLIRGAIATLTQTLDHVSAIDRADIVFAIDSLKQVVGRDQ